MSHRLFLFYALGLWVIAVAAGLAARPILPVDETRYVTVAWEMWLRGDYLVPYLNGETYSHKPPLLFWLMQAGWAVFGVNDFTPRLVAPLFGLGAVIMTWALARRIWPDDPLAAGLAPLILMGAVFWTLFTSLTMFDMLLSLCAVMGAYGIVTAVRGQQGLGFLVLAVAVGIGGLAKGPAILLHIVPVALTAPWWAPALTGEKVRVLSYFGGMLVALVAGIGITLAWAIPAGIAGGEEYRNAIFWGQSAGRVVNSFDHGRPFWWYAATLPALILPWLIWPALWRRVREGGRTLLSDGGIRLALVWVAVAFLVFSAISGKQLHYLLPEFPALALIAARVLSLAENDERRTWDVVAPMALFALLGVAVFVVFAFELTPSWATTAEGGVGLPMLFVALAALAVAWRVRLSASGLVPVLTGFSVALIVAFNVAAGPAVRQAHDLKPFAETIKTWEDRGYDVAFYGRTYHGHFHFLGRLTRPFDWVGDQELQDWMAAHPTGKIIEYRHRTRPADDDGADAVHPFRSGYFIMWDAARHRGREGLIGHN